MPRLNPRMHIAIGLAFLVLSVLLAAEFIGLIPDRIAAIREGRIALVETLAATSVEVARRGDITWVAPTLRLAVRRNPALISAGLRNPDGELRIDAGNHAHHWSLKAGELSTDDQVWIPIQAGDRQWGRLELRFSPIAPSNWRQWLTQPLLVLVAFVFASSLMVFYFYLGKVLRHLDPSGAVPSRVRHALDTLSEGLIVLDRKQTIVLVNRAFSGFSGADGGALVGTNVSALDWRDENDEPVAQANTPWAQALATGEARTNYALALRTGDGVRRTFQINCAPVLVQGSRPGGVLVSLDDITAIEQYSVELQKAKNEADAANRAKSDFLANMSHEIRTPMNAILGFTEVLRRGHTPSDAKARHHLNVIHASGTHLLDLINDILDLSKVEAGRLDVESIPCSPFSIAQQVIQAMSVKADEKQLGLTLEVSGRIPESIHSDPARLRQILTNLIGNALKFTDHGGVTLRLTFDAGERPAHVRFDVIDTGIGIPPDRLDSVFDPFVQADSSVNRRFGGTGLGLAISQRFARALGGDIQVTSTPGRGSTFSATVLAGDLDGVTLADASSLRAQLETASFQSDTRHTIRPGARILVVDDGDENRELVATVLAEYGIEPAQACNGQEAIAQTEATSFDLIFMDIQMPVMDGFEATRRLRAADVEIPIVALTANAMHGFEQEVLDAGFTAYLTKPIDIDTFLATVARFVPGNGPSAEPVEQTGPATPALAANTVDGNDRSAIVSQLADRERMRPVIERFISRLRERIPDFKQALHEGDLGALAAHAHWLKGAGGTVGFPGLTEVAETLETAAHGADTTSCAHTMEKLAAMSAQLSVGEETDAQAPSPAPDIASAEPVEAADIHPVVSSLAAHTRFAPMITRFVERMHGQTPLFEEAMTDQNGPELARLAHWLKGAGGTVGFDQFTEPARRLEDAAKADDMACCKQQLQIILNLVSRMQSPVS